MRELRVTKAGFRQAGERGRGGLRQEDGGVCQLPHHNNIRHRTLRKGHFLKRTTLQSSLPRSGAGAWSPER